MSTEPQEKGQSAQTQAGDGQRCRVDARGAEGLLVGDQGTQINYFYKGTWTDGVAPPPLVSMSGTITSPYRGLSAFGERDVALFFGRESAATQVLELMSRRLEGTGLVVVSGVSGAGKSSLLRAGVLPRLRGAGLGPAPEAASWPCLVFTPGRRPLEELAVRVAPVAGAEATAVLQSVAADPAGFALTARQAALAHLDTPAPEGGLPDGAGQRRVLLVIDQFEQLFTQCEDEDERQAFITALHAAATKTDGGRKLPAAAVVILVRADFEARLADYPLLGASVQDRYLLTSMTERQLRMAITQPAVTAGSSVDSDLVQVLLEDVRTRSGSPTTTSGSAAIGAGVLPLLSHALDQAWRGRTGQGLSLADYERTGGIEGAVADSAQRAYDRLTPSQQTMARQAFICLTATSSDGVDYSARATRAVLTAGKTEAQVRDVEAVLETFTAERLLTLAAGSIEISHEALLTAWPLLRDNWLADSHADRIIRTRLRDTAAEWARSSNDRAYLYGGSLLEAATASANRVQAAPSRHPPLSQDERDFLQVSIKASQRAGAIRRAATAGLVILLVVVAAAAVLAAVQNRNAVHQRDVAASGQLAFESESPGQTNPRISDLEAVTAWRINPSSQTRYATLEAATRPETAVLAGTRAVYSAAYSSNGKLLATFTSDGTIQLWNAVTREPIGRPLTSAHSQAVNSMAFSPDGQVLAVGAPNGTVRLWNTVTRQPIGRPLYTGTTVYSMSFGPDDQHLAIGSTGKVEVWNLATRQLSGHPLYGTAGTAVSVAFSRDGDTIAMSSGTIGNMVSLWNATTQRPIGQPIPLQITNIDSMAFSPDGAVLALGGENGGAQLCTVTILKCAKDPLIADDIGTNTGSPVAFSPDGKTLATGTDDTIRLWNVFTGQLIGNPLTSSSGEVYSVAFSPNGAALASGTNDGAVDLWNLSQYLPIGELSGGTWPVAISANAKIAAIGTPGSGAQLWNIVTRKQIGNPIGGSMGGLSSVALSPDGKILATKPILGQLQLWNTATGQQVRIPGKFFAPVAFSPDGKTLATGTANGGVQLWNAITFRPINHALPSGPGQDPIASMTFSPSGKVLATSDSSGTVRLWNIATAQPIGHPLPSESGAVLPIAFSPDGKLFVTGYNDGTAQLWNAQTFEPIGGPLPTNAGFVDSVAFSPDGNTLATGGFYGTVRLWDVATRQPIGSPLAVNSGTVGSLVFTHDGKTLLVGAHGGVQLWNVAYLSDVLPDLCALSGHSFTPAEWVQYVPPGSAYQKVCP